MPNKNTLELKIKRANELAIVVKRKFFIWEESSEFVLDSCLLKKDYSECIRAKNQVFTDCFEYVDEIREMHDETKDATIRRLLAETIATLVEIRPNFEASAPLISGIKGLHEDYGHEKGVRVALSTALAASTPDSHSGDDWLALNLRRLEALYLSHDREAEIRTIYANALAREADEQVGQEASLPILISLRTLCDDARAKNPNFHWISGPDQDERELRKLLSSCLNDGMTKAEGEVRTRIARMLSYMEDEQRSGLCPTIDANDFIGADPEFDDLDEQEDLEMEEYWDEAVHTEELKASELEDAILQDRINADDQLAGIHMAARMLDSEIPSPDSGRIDSWIDQISSVYDRLQRIAVEGDASSGQVGLAMDAREILANALAEAIWLRPSDLSLLVMLRQLHTEYQEESVRFALARSLATCEPCPIWIGELAVTNPAELNSLTEELNQNRVAELRKLYEDFHESDVFDQLLQVDPTSSR